MLVISKDSCQHLKTISMTLWMIGVDRLVPRSLTYTCTKSDFRLPVTLQNLLKCTHVETHWPWIMFFPRVRVWYGLCPKKIHDEKQKTTYGTSVTRTYEGRARSIAVTVTQRFALKNICQIRKLGLVLNVAKMRTIYFFIQKQRQKPKRNPDFVNRVKRFPLKTKFHSCWHAALDWSTQEDILSVHWATSNYTLATCT